MPSRSEGPTAVALQGEPRENGGRGVHFSDRGLREHVARCLEQVTPWLEQHLPFVLEDDRGELPVEDLEHEDHGLGKTSRCASLPPLRSVIMRRWLSLHNPSLALARAFHKFFLLGWLTHYEKERR